MKVGYARVSTFEQDLDLQMDALEKEGCDRIFCDQSESGAKAHRPEWDNCLDHLRKGDTLVIWKLDRASRSTKHLIELAEDLKKKGVELRSLKEQIDTSTAMSKFFFRMTASIAELERDIIRERTLTGLAAARARGHKGSRKKSITEGQMLEAKRLAEAGKLSITDICAKVGISRAITPAFKQKPFLVKGLCYMAFRAILSDLLSCRSNSYYRLAICSPPLTT